MREAMAVPTAHLCVLLEFLLAFLLLWLLGWA